VFWRRDKEGNTLNDTSSVGNVGNPVGNVGNPVGNVGNPVSNVGDSDGNVSVEDTNLERVVMNCLRGDVTMSAAKIAKVANVTTRTIERTLVRLKNSGNIRRVGGTRGSWVVLK